MSAEANTPQMIRNDRIVHDLAGAMSKGEHGIGVFPGLLLLTLKEEAWRERVIQYTGEHVQFASFSEFMAARPPEGLGTTKRTLENICRDNTEALSRLDQALRGQHGGDHGNQYTGGKVDNINDAYRPTGTSRAAGLRRLRKDRPDLHARVLADELSVHAAMIEAGFRKRPTALDILIRAWGKASPEERVEFVNFMRGEAF